MITSTKTRTFRALVAGVLRTDLKRVWFKSWRAEHPGGPADDVNREWSATWLP